MFFCGTLSRGHFTSYHFDLPPVDKENAPRDNSHWINTESMVRFSTSHWQSETPAPMSIGERSPSVMSSISKPTLALILLSLSVLAVALVYQPLPDDFPQPWKYRFLSFWAHLFSKIVGNRWRSTSSALSLHLPRVMSAKRWIYSIVLMSYAFCTTWLWAVFKYEILNIIWR